MDQDVACMPRSNACSRIVILGFWSFTSDFTGIMFPSIINTQTFRTALSMDNIIILYTMSLNHNSQRLILTIILGDFADIKQAGRYPNIISKEKMKVFHSILIFT